MTDISTLAAETSRLLNFYQGAESTINTKLNQVLQSEVKHFYTYYVDAELGDDSNDGLTRATAFRTFNRAARRASHISGSRISIRFKNKDSNGQPLVYTSTINHCTTSYIFLSIIGYDFTTDNRLSSESVKPIIKAGTSGHQSFSSFWDFRCCNVNLFDFEIHSHNDGGKDPSGLFRCYNDSMVNVSRCTLKLTNSRLFRLVTSKLNIVTTTLTTDRSSYTGCRLLSIDDSMQTIRIKAVTRENALADPEFSWGSLIYGTPNVFTTTNVDLT